MSRRKRYLIDKKLQLRATFSIIVVVTTLSVIIISAIAFIVVYNNEKLENILKIQDNIVEFLESRISNVDSQIYRGVLENIAKNHTNNIKTLNRIVKNNKILILSIIVFTIFQGIILYIILIRITHRISGPIYLMSLYIQEIIEGGHPVPRALRSKDELKDFYELFKQMVIALEERENKKISSID